MNDDVTTTIRISKELRNRISKFCDKFRKKTGAELNFSTAMRTLLEQALTASEKKS